MNMSLGRPQKGVKSFSELVTAINNEQVEKLTIEDTFTKAVIKPPIGNAHTVP